MIHTKQFCCTGFFKCNFPVAVLLFGLSADTLSHIYQNLQLHSKLTLLLKFMKFPLISCFCNGFLFTSGTIHVNHF